ncbi:recombinase family protein [Gordonia humi]|uniref:DNA invertase Pin-like site-specific DNA recombinase n=1 Tax=Gordonia humi TaxID=686429 RepID=A0A840ESQ6_9ACTN|nr:recombinase family protein [Gordonia humi]MBB4135905.1 DNA invertase Pin-like site-specific DNA recombinase [Gordonia humi]
MRNQRALIVTRLSRVTDATTSPERQLDACRELCEKRGYQVVGVAEDLDVSAGKTSPFDRPQLGRWLDDPTRYDMIVFFRVDRIVRRLFDLADPIRWARQHDVALVSATEAHFDLSTDFGDIIALLVAKVAEMELEAISERNSNAFRHNIKAGKWRGGVPPWGYLPERDDEGTWRLVQDAEQVAVIHEVVQRVLAGEPLRAIAHDLTGRGILTPKDRFAQVKGRDVANYEWHSAPLKRMLTSLTLLDRIRSPGNQSWTPRAAYSATTKATARWVRERSWSVKTVRRSSVLSRSSPATCSSVSVSNCRAGRTGRNPRGGVRACCFGSSTAGYVAVLPIA